MNPARPGALRPNNPPLETQKETPKVTPKITLSCCDACDSEEKTAVVKPAAPQLSCCGSCSTDASTTTEQKSKSRFSFHFISAKQRLVVAGVLAIAAETLDWFDVPALFPALLALLAVVLSGVATYKKGWQALRRFDPNMHALMSIAVTGACLIGQWPEAAMVMVLFNIAEYLEGKSLERARNAIQELMTLTPEQALVQQADGNWKVLYTNTVSVNQVIRVKPGVRIPLDGIVIRGNSSVDQAPITGESLPVDKNAGDVVYAGTINQQGSFDYKVTATTQNTLLARIIHSVEQAQGQRAPIQRLVDRFARVYTPIILTIAVLVALVPPLFFAASWY
ncbi:MAG: HAD-IC family P-type ATPase, partial [Tolumonas sp.]|nr:HAD-IC family P-type ATPase [Tolumonas sp.]